MCVLVQYRVSTSTRASSSNQQHHQHHSIVHAPHATFATSRHRTARQQHQLCADLVTITIASNSARSRRVSCAVAPRLSCRVCDVNRAPSILSCRTIASAIVVSRNPHPLPVRLISELADDCWCCGLVDIQNSCGHAEIPHSNIHEPHSNRVYA